MSACADPAAALAACAALAGLPDPFLPILPLPDIADRIETRAMIEGAKEETAGASGLLKLFVAAMYEHADTIFLSLELTHDLH